jgi:CHAT domain-containing protein
VTSRYDIVHFIGHGYWDQGVSGLVLEDENGGRFNLDERNLREMFAGRKLRVVFLNACDTGRGTGPGSKPYSIGGTAQSLFGRGIQVVVANQLKVRDRAAADFARPALRLPMPSGARASTGRSRSSTRAMPEARWCRREPLTTTAA